MSEWRRIEYAARNRMQADARNRVLELLDEGKISIGAVPEGLAGATRPGGIVLNRAALQYSTGNLAFLVAHEGQHLSQFSGVAGFGRFVRYAFSDALKRREGTYVQRLEGDANAYACAYTYGYSGSYRAMCSP